MKQLPLFDAVEIPLTNGYVTFVDPIDADLANLTWTGCISSGLIYASRSAPKDGTWREQSLLTIHRIVLARILGRELSNTELVDHWDRNGLNNRRRNLRLATPSQNGANKVTTIGASGYKGVVWCKTHKQWKPQITVQNRRIFLGYYDDLIEAARAYDTAAIEYFGEFALTNVMLGLLPLLEGGVK